MKFLFEPSAAGFAALLFPILAIKAVAAFLIGYGAKRKGYGYWQFFFAALLLEPLTCVAVLLAIPKIVGGKVVEED